MQEYGPPKAPTTIVLLHPALYSRKSLGLQVTAWKPHFRLLVPDLPAHGSRLEEPFTYEAAVEQVSSLIRMQAPSAKVVLFGMH